MTALVPIAQLNAASRVNFVEALRLLFEAATPLADALYDARPYESYPALLDTAERVIHALPADQQRQVLNAHPRLGEKRDVVRQTSALSFAEQGYDAEADIDPAVLAQTYATLDELNREYEARFGFRCVVFVNRRPKSEIVEVLRQRLHGSPEVELRMGLSEMVLIARDRLRTLTATRA